MNASSHETAGTASIDVVRSLIQQLLGDGDDDGEGDGAVVAATARLEADLQLESLDVLALAGLLHERYGPRVDLGAYLASLDFDDLLGVTVLDVADYVTTRVGA